MRAPIIAGFLLLLFLPALSLAQVTTGSLEGFILDQDELPLAGARFHLGRLRRLGAARATRAREISLSRRRCCGGALGAPGPRPRR